MCRIDQAQSPGDLPPRSGGRIAEDHLPDDWNLVSTTPSNVWMMGDGGTIAHLLEALRPSLAEPVVTTRSGDSLVLPNVSEVGTLVLFDAQALGLADQHRLNSWLDEIGCRARVISTSRASVLPMIEAAMFLESLYYRLNTLHLHVGPANRDTTGRQELAVHF
jgi:hypothetical protein